MNRPWLCALAVAAVGTAVVTQAPKATAAATPFYDPPAVLPPNNGDLIRYEEYFFDGTVGHRILYRSTNAVGDAVAVSGLVLVPTAPWEGDGPRPVIGYGPGTVGLGDECTTSQNMNPYEWENINSLINAGYAVAVTDYEGLGTPGTHTYAVGQSQGRAVLDAVRAATQVYVIGGPTPSSPVALVGYSQGGQSAVWAGELQPSYAPELDLYSIAAGGVPADLRSMADDLDGTQWFGLAAAATIGYSAAYPDLNVADHLEWWRRWAYRAAEDYCFDELTENFYERTWDSETDTSPLDDADWQARMDENKAGMNPLPVPTLLMHGTTDDMVPYPQAEAMKDRYCAQGNKITWRTSPGDHYGASALFRAELRPFVEELFARPDGSGLIWTCN